MTEDQEDTETFNVAGVQKIQVQDTPEDKHILHIQRQDQETYTIPLTDTQRNQLQHKFMLLDPEGEQQTRGGNPFQ